MFETFKNRLEITGSLKTITALRISTGRSTEPIGSDLPVIKDALGRPLIPGSSFKGAMRSRLESFVRAIHPEFAANPAQEDEWSISPEKMSQFKDQIKNLKSQEQELQLHEYIISNTDLVSSVFGSPWISSKLQISDLTIEKPEENWFGQYQERDGVAIDRDTETAGDGKLYDFQVVPAGTPFSFHVVIENAEEWELGMLMIGLSQFEKMQIPLGGGRSRGLGVVKLDIKTMNWVDVRHDNDKSETDPDKVLKYLKALISSDLKATPYEVLINTDVEAESSDEKVKEKRAAWADAFVNKLSRELQEISNTPANDSSQPTNHA